MIKWRWFKKKKKRFRELYSQCCALTCEGSFSVLVAKHLAGFWSNKSPPERTGEAQDHSLYKRRQVQTILQTVEKTKRDENRLVDSVEQIRNRDVHH